MLLTVTSHGETLFLELVGDITWAGSGDFDPGLGEDSAGGQHEGNVDQGVDRVNESILKVERWGHVVADTGAGEELSGSVSWFPNTEESDQKVIGKSGVENLREQEDVGRESGLQHDWHVAGVEEANWVGSTSTTVAGRLDWDFNTETLEIDDGGEDNESSQKVHDVWEVLAVESLLKSTLLVWPGEEEMEQGDNSTLELWSTSGIDGGWAESLPDDALANVGSNEQGDSGSETVSLLEKLIKKDGNQTGDNQLENQQDTDTSTKVAWLSVQSSQNVDGSLSKREDDGEHCSREVSLVFEDRNENKNYTDISGRFGRVLGQTSSQG